MMKKILAVLLSASVLVLSIVPVSAASTYCGLNYINIEVNGVIVANIGDTYMLDNGEEVPFSLLYEGTTYIPMRKLAELLGNKVEWDQATKTAYIISSENGLPVIEENISQDKEGMISTINAEWNYVNIQIDGVQVAGSGESYKLDNGNSVPFSILYKGTTYLPIRKISGILFKKIDFDAVTMTAKISEPEVLPVLGYDKMTDVPDFGSVYEHDPIYSGIVGDMMTYTYDYENSMDLELKAYKSKLAAKGFKLINESESTAEAYTQNISTMYNEKTFEIVGILITHITSSDESVLSIMLGVSNPNYTS